MAINFSELKNNRSKNTQKLIESLEPKQQSYNTDADEFWKPTLDDEKGVAGAVIRFLPSKDESTLPYVKYFEHAFKGPTGKWYIEKSLSTIGKQDAVGKLNAALWNSGVESDKKIARDQKRLTRYVANILIVNDPSRPELNGTVKKYRFGPGVFEFIQKALKPTPDALTGQTPDSVDVFDMWEGANLQIRMKKTKQYGWNYDDTDWSAVCPVAKSDEQIEEIFNKTYSLAYLVADDQFKSPEALEARLVEVLGNGYIGSGIPVVANYTEKPQQSKPQSQPMVDQGRDDPPFEPTKKAIPELDTDDDDFFNDLMND